MGMNGTMMQYFQWDLPADASLWKALAEDAAKLKTAGVTAVWLPPAYKGAQGKDTVSMTCMIWVSLIRRALSRQSMVRKQNT
jgi:hypothetical protein